MDAFKKTDFNKLKKYIEQSIDQFDMISYERKIDLKSLSDHIKALLSSSNYANLNFICTHNSRRSHLSQLWAQTAAHYYNVENVYCFSGGTEATEFNRNAIDAIKRAGFKSLKITNSLNPTYHVFYTNNNFSTHYSKIYYDPPNPNTNYIAIITCGSANESCPVVDGCSKKISLLYEDPKKFDGTAKEGIAYDDRCREISRELLFTFSLL